MVPVRLFISLFGLAITLWFAPRAASWEVCNETSFVLRVAHATTIDGALTPKGWTRARPGQCLFFTAAPGEARYVYAESSVAHQGGIREWRGNRALCADDADFEASLEITCALQDMGSRNFLSVDPGELKTGFVEIDDFGSTAETAGMQRLLRDLGYTVPRIDGKSGRQTSRSLNKFLKSAGLTQAATPLEILDALERTALSKREEIGITLCNKSNSKMWTAVAYRLGAAWESKGWWPIDPGACLRPHTESILRDDAHIYALLETDTDDDKILKSTTAVPAQFCVAQSRFSATLRENCADRGYRAASFRPLPTDKDGVTVNLTDADFIQSNKGGLRQ